MPGRGEVPPEKIARVEALAKDVLAQRTTALIGVRGVPAAALQTMRRTLRSGGRPIRVAPNSTIRYALERAAQKRPALKPLLDQVEDQTAVLAAEVNPFSLADELRRTRSPTPARGGEVAPADIVVPAQTTSFKPGPIVGELQHAGFPASIEKGKVVLKREVTIVKAGATISREVAGLLTRLEIFPLEVGLSLRAVVDGETYYPPSLLAVDLGAQRDQVALGARLAVGVAVELGYASRETIEPLVARAYRGALAVAVAAGHPTPETVAPLLLAALRSALAVGEITRQNS
jgi:large subunit ribosomal protein L10